MKKLIALFATTAVASGSAMGAIALSGTASVSYDDNGSAAASETSYDAELSIVGTAGSTTLTAGYDMEGASLATTGVDLATTIGPMTISADMHNATEDSTDNGDGDFVNQQDDRGVSVSLSETCAVKLSNPKDLNTYNTRSITFLNSLFNCSGVQKIWASS